MLEEGYIGGWEAGRHPDARRGVMGPGYYAYTLGKHDILSWCGRLEQKRGSKFDLLRIQEAFMKLPYPIPVIERILFSWA